MPADAAPPVPSGAASARFVRQRTLPGFGIAAQQRLLDARVVVVGAGGLGSIVIPALAAAGVGTLVIVDDDTVDVTNLHRQTIHDAVDVGERKAASAAARVAALSPDTRVEVRSERLTTTNAARIAEGADLLVDASDNFPTRYLLDDLGTLAGIPVVWGSVSQYAGQVGVAAGPDAPSYRDLFPVPPAPDAVVSCEVGGVLPTVCGAIGALMAGEAIKLLTGVGEPLIGRVAIFDSLTTRFREVEFGRDPDAFWANTGTEVPYLETANHYFVSATLSEDPSAPVGRFLGDLLVLRPSAWSHGRGERLRFPVDQYTHLGGATHFDLLNHPAIYEQIERWLTAGRELPASTGL